MEEIWKDVPGYEGLYQVSNIGRVKRDGKILSQSKNRGGYLRLNLSKDGKAKKIMTHKLVAMAFLNHKPCGMKRVIDHINNIKTDNRAENLQITTVRHNSSKDKKGHTSKYIGVCWDKYAKKWVSQIHINGKKERLGRFKCEKKAYLAYKKRLNSINNSFA